MKYVFIQKLQIISIGAIKQLKSKIRVLENHPKLKRSGADIKKIRDANPEAYRLRIGDYRVIYVIEEGIVWITEIMHRQKGYRYH
jgi:mRNA interferase RelE/StbE